MPLGVTNVCVTVLLFDGLFVHPFVCNISFANVSVRLSVKLFEHCLSMCASVHVSVRSSACMHIFV